MKNLIGACVIIGIRSCIFIIMAFIGKHKSDGELVTRINVQDIPWLDASLLYVHVNRISIIYGPFHIALIIQINVKEITGDLLHHFFLFCCVGKDSFYMILENHAFIRSLTALDRTVINRYCLRIFLKINGFPLVRKQLVSIHGRILDRIQFPYFIGNVLFIENLPGILDHIADCKTA